MFWGLTGKVLAGLVNVVLPARPRLVCPLFGKHVYHICKLAET